MRTVQVCILSENHGAPTRMGARTRSERRGPQRRPEVLMVVVKVELYILGLLYTGSYNLTAPPKGNLSSLTVTTADPLPGLVCLAPAFLPASGELDLLALPLSPNILLALFPPESNRRITPVPASCLRYRIPVFHTSATGNARRGCQCEEQRLLGIDVDRNSTGLFHGHPMGIGSCWGYDGLDNGRQLVFVI